VFFSWVAKSDPLDDGGSTGLVLCTNCTNNGNKIKRFLFGSALARELIESNREKYNGIIASKL